MKKLIKTLEHLAIPLLMAIVTGAMEFSRAKAEADQEETIEQLNQRVYALEHKED
jgi:hypothetical protein